MFEMSLLFLIGRVIPESLLFAWAFYTLSQTKIHVKRCFLSVIIMVILACGINLLPIHCGVHTLLTMVGIIITNIVINKISTIKSITVTFGTIIIEFICEIIDLFTLHYFFNVDTEYIASNAQLKILYGLPSLLLFVLIIILLKAIIIKIEIKKAT
ncbi:hypothetical protein psyc5s11_19770 [Clostridium gelidum]|uniref:Uncharacterized protein n=1 Tax=Clostridium gelidum TaxID=704125 RepID=A0ABN6IUP9_9CLOT|nr:hypothetical protein [Clostridium gelidum]BCZ45910.1 hypothetical protein psyc5s11_19770 [Clostridium gelidum]